MVCNSTWSLYQLLLTWPSWHPLVNLQMHRHKNMLGQQKEQCRGLTFRHLLSMNVGHLVWRNDVIRHCGHYSTSFRIMACCLMTSSPYLDQFWATIKSTPFLNVKKTVQVFRNIITTTRLEITHLKLKAQNEDFQYTLILNKVSKGILRELCIFPGHWRLT